MTSYCNMRCCDSCRRKVSIDVVMPWMEDDGTRRESLNDTYCLNHIADRVAARLGRSISISWGPKNVDNSEDDNGSGDGILLTEAQGTEEDAEELAGTLPKPDSYTEDTEGTVGETYLVA